MQASQKPKIAITIGWLTFTLVALGLWSEQVCCPRPTPFQMIALYLLLAAPAWYYWGSMWMWGKVWLLTRRMTLISLLGVVVIVAAIYSLQFGEHSNEPAVMQQTEPEAMAAPEPSDTKAIGENHYDAIAKQYARDIGITEEEQELNQAYEQGRAAGKTWGENYKQHLQQISDTALQHGWENQPSIYLLNAAKEGDIQKAEQALAERANINATFLGLSPLYTAAGAGHAKFITWAISKGADINFKNGPAQRTALHEAAGKGQLEAVKALLNAGADISATNSHGRTPLAYLRMIRPANLAEVERLLVEKGGVK